MLEDYPINERVRYAGHRLIVDEDLEIGGALGAALACAMLVDTEEGMRRGIALDSEADRRAWIEKYEREVRRDEWGLIDVELNLLSEAYIELATSGMTLTDICPNIRLTDLALHMLSYYMRHLSIEYFGAHIWEYQAWEAPFAQWLLEASRGETLRQRFLHTEWTDPAMVTALAETMRKADGTDMPPTLFFEGEAAEDIMKQYYQWRWNSYAAQLRELPGAQPRAAKHRNYLYEQETEQSFPPEEIASMDEADQRLWAQWMMDWQAYLHRQLKPEKPIVFWTAEVSELRKKQLTQYLRIQEKEWDYYKCLSGAIYAMRQLGYVRRGCPVRDITRWMSENLVNDYTAKNNHDQFYRAWKELGRYTEEVRHFVNELNRLV